MLTNAIFAAIFFVFVSWSANASEIVRFTLFDGETTDGKLSLPPDTSRIKELVIFVHGTGPGTYDNHRKFGTFDFNYFDYFANEFNRRGIAFFTYDKRGVTIGDKPPLFDKVDREKFRKCVPSIEVKDLATFITTLRTDKRLKRAKIVLLGWSEGTILAAMAADDKRNNVGALFLNGYVHDSMFDVIKWQNSGGSSMVNLRGVFDNDNDGSISRAEYESDDKAVVAFRTGPMQNAKFEQLDVDQNGTLTIADFAILQKARYQAIMDAYERGDEDWIWKNYFRVTIPWLKEHFALEANKDRLMRLKMPIYIFHGGSDANCPVEGVYDLRKRFDAAGMKNLHESVFKGADHDLNFFDWVEKKQISEGIAKMFEVASDIVTKH